MTRGRWEFVLMLWFLGLGFAGSHDGSFSRNLGLTITGISAGLILGNLLWKYI